MIYLLANTASQTMRLSLDEARQFLPSYTHYLLIISHEENSDFGSGIAQVPNVVLENQRITQLQVTTIGLLLTGMYRYIIYGQNSASNTNPFNAAVVGVCERGTLIITDSTGYYDVPTLNLDNDVIYQG